jgi:tetratricopeptide (TPR) repeat protein
MSKKKKDTNSQGNDLIENPEALAQQFSKTEEFVEKNKSAVMVLGGIVAIGILAYFFGTYYISEQNSNAQRDMFQAVYYFEADSLGKALNGDGNNYGFLEIIDEYSMTSSANIANFYAGASYLKLGDNENGLRYLKEFSSSDYLVQSRAYSLMGDASMDLEDFVVAASYYEKAADYNANKQFSPTYLMKAAVANEKSSNYEGAITNYQSIIDNYYNGVDYNDAKKHKARLEGMLN